MAASAHVGGVLRGVLTAVNTYNVPDRLESSNSDDGTNGVWWSA